MEDKQVYDYLADRGVKGSVQRVAVMKYLLEHCNHPAVDDIYTELVDALPTLSKTTIYNTLKLFVEQGVVRMLTIDGKNANFDGDVSPHAHFFCTQCERIFDVPQPEFAGSIDHELPQGFHAEVTELYFKGLCPECRKKANAC